MDDYAGCLSVTRHFHRMRPRIIVCDRSDRLRAKDSRPALRHSVVRPAPMGTNGFSQNLRLNLSRALCWSRCF